MEKAFDLIELLLEEEEILVLRLMKTASAKEKREFPIPISHLNLMEKANISIMHKSKHNKYIG